MYVNSSGQPMRGLTFQINHTGTTHDSQPRARPAGSNCPRIEHAKKTYLMKPFRKNSPHFTAIGFSKYVEWHILGKMKY